MLLNNIFIVGIIRSIVMFKIHVDFTNVNSEYPRFDTDAVLYTNICRIVVSIIAVVTSIIASIVIKGFLDLSI